MRALVRSGAAREGVQFECRFRHADGSWRWLECSARSYGVGLGDVHGVVIARDVTQRVEAQRQVQESEQRFRLLAETIHDHVVEFDAEGRVLYTSPGSVELLGVRPEEMVGTTPFTNLHPDDIERCVESFLDLIQTPSPAKPMVVRVRHRDGSWRTIEGGGVSYRTAEGEHRIVAIARDITELVRAEKEHRRLEERMQQAQRLESLGAMAGGIAHDFNNLLTPILGEASLALMDLPEDSTLAPRLRKIQDAAHRAAILTQQLLAYAGAESLQVERLDLSGLVRDMDRLVATADASKATLDYDLGPGLPAIEGDAAQLRQLVMNLVTNASEAVGEGESRIAIRTGRVDLDRCELRRALLGEELSEGSYVYLEVEDTGCGIDATKRAKVFDPFFTTKFTGRGLGLAAVMGIVRAHQGAIEMQSAPGIGTRVRVFLPVPSSARTAGAPEASDPKDWRGSGTVLVVDDDAGVREFTADTLERAGLSVLCVGDARRAVELFREHVGQIRCVLLDCTMPAIGGKAVFDAIRRIRPDARVILVSGYSQARAVFDFADQGLCGFLQKPFLPETLLEKLRCVLEE